MKPQWQQQEQMRQQQEQQRHQMEMAAWQQQQQETQNQNPPPDTTSREKDQFVRVEQEVARLRQDMVAGRLTEEQFKARLKELMVRDEQGTWWMVGAETGNWYRHDATNWVQAIPPGHTAPQPTTTLQPERQVAFTKPVKQETSNSRGFVKLLLFLFIGLFFLVFYVPVIGWIISPLFLLLFTIYLLRLIRRR